MQPAVAHAGLDRAAAEAEREQLPVGHQRVLSSRDVRDSPINMEFDTAAVSDSRFVLHRPDDAGSGVTAVRQP